jgi:hypothetical protein
MVRTSCFPVTTVPRQHRVLRLVKSHTETTNRCVRGKVRTHYRVPPAARGTIKGVKLAVRHAMVVHVMIRVGSSTERRRHGVLL